VEEDNVRHSVVVNSLFSSFREQGKKEENTCSIENGDGRLGPTPGKKERKREKGERQAELIDSSTKRGGERRRGKERVKPVYPGSHPRVLKGKGGGGGG